MFSGAHFGENPSKSEPRRLPTGTHFLLFFMFSGPWASKGASCDLLGSRGPALGSPGARQNSNSLQKHTFYEGDFQKQPFRSRAGPRRLQKDTIPDRRHKPQGLYNKRLGGREPKRQEVRTAAKGSEVQLKPFRRATALPEPE